MYTIYTTFHQTEQSDIDERLSVGKSDENLKKKKKKKRSKKTEEEEEWERNDVKADEEINGKEKIAKWKVTEESCGLNGTKDSVKEISLKKAKKGKKLKRAVDESESLPVSGIGVEEEGICSVKRKRKKSAEQDNRAKSFVDKKDVNDEESSNSVKKKKKTKCKRVECEEEVLVTGNCDESDQRSKKKKKKTKAGESEKGVIENCDEKDIRTKKKKKKKKNQNGKDIEAERQLEFNEKGAKKDRKGRVKMADSDAVENGGANDSQSDNYVGKKRKKKKDRGSEDDPAPKKSKEVHEPEGQSGNTQTDPNTAYSGQWNTASLGDEQRQNKFLRLLGGFKAAKSDGSPLNTLGAKYGNVAMTQNQEDSYVRSMEDQYGKAMSFNQNRGLGLGFQRPPSEGKKFYIDKNISKSRKFDD